MSQVPFRVVPLAGQNRSGFTSGTEALDHYFQHQVTQDVRRRVAACFVALTPEGQIGGFYTVAAASVVLSDLPAGTAKKLPRYPSVPAVRMGRLAVAQEFAGQGLGGALLADALARAAQSEIAAFAMVVDAKGEATAAFYQHHGFVALPSSPLTLFLPLATVGNLPNLQLAEKRLESIRTGKEAAVPLEEQATPHDSQPSR